jgi:monovalent cation/proton antiporter MnhG/PhaG subunit
VSSAAVATAVVWKEVLVGVLLASVVLINTFSVLGLLFMPNLMDRLHFLTPATSVAGPLMAGAVVTTEALDHQGIIAILVAVILLFFGPVITHATARAARIRDLGDWHAKPDEKVHRP